MKLKNLQNLMSKEKRRNERAKTAQSFVAGIGVAMVLAITGAILVAVNLGREENEMKKHENLAETLKANVQKKAESVKDSIETVKNDTLHAVKKDIRSKADDVKKSFR